MKKLFSSIILILVVVSMLFVTACNGVQDAIKGAKPLSVPTNLRVDEQNTLLLWNSVEYASGYTVKANDTTYTTNTNAFSLSTLPSGEYTISVKANGDGILYETSGYSDTIKYTRETSSGNEYSDDVVAAFKEFDEINTKNSFLGYGIDIINASAITSKNVLMTYPIFDMDKLMDEKLLKSNEHYNMFESIEAATIEEFSENMSTSTSITSGANVSAKGNIKGVDVSASASLSSGLTTSFTKTSELVESQYFLQIVAENQSYWLVLQTTEQRYKDLLSEEFKADLYDKTVTPAQLFGKYGTHMLTSVAMGGNICMYYTMYSYDKSVGTGKYAEVSSTLKTNVEAAYGGYSAGVGTENSFQSTFTYETLAHNYGIQIDKKIISAGGGSFGINNEKTLYENYYDWQKSLDTYPVVIGIKDTNSLYPVWQLLDLSIEGAAERYTELYNYFQEYGSKSYNTLCETYKITPSVAPTDICDITVGEHENYTENQVVNVRAGETLQISFNVLPHNANKYLKTFSVDNPALAKVDESGIVSILPTASGGSYVKVTVTAGSVSKQITLYVINTYNVTFNTRVDGLSLTPMYGVLEGYTIDEPSISREGYTLEGWYTDAQNTDRFDFETDCVTSHLTLYAKWVPIKPVVSFDTLGGSDVDSQTLAYNGTAKKPKDPTFTGYVFDGWYLDEDCTEQFDFSTTVISDITLYAKWEKIEYEVSFITGGGTPVASVVTSIEDGYRITEPETSRQYYTLDGWYLDEGLTQKFYFESEITSDVTLYAKWTAQKAVVKFLDTDGVSAVYDEWGFAISQRTTDIDKEFKITAPTPCKEGHTFVGWFLDGTRVELEEYSEFKPCDEGYTLLAVWKVNSYTISFVVNGAEYTAEAFEFGEEIFYPEMNVKGHEFSGWSYGYKELPKTMPAKDITVTGELVKKNYTLSYYVDGELYTKKTYAFGDKITLIDEPHLEGKVFSGWMCADFETVPVTMPAQDVKIEGGFNRESFNIYYYIDDVLVKTQPVKNGFSFPVFVPEEKVGYVFSGWLVKDGEDTSLLPEVMPSKDIRAYGSYKLKTVTVTFDSNGGTPVESITAEYGAALTAPEAPTREGYTFVSWDKSMPSTMPGEDTIFTAIWKINVYTVTFNTNGGSVIDPIPFEYGAEIVLPKAPTKTGCEFVGWDKVIPTTMPAENITLSAIWKVNGYTITFDSNGGTPVESITAEYGAAVTAPADPTRLGYKFDGWDIKIPATMPSENITVTAKWTLYTSSVRYEENSETSIDGDTLKGDFAVNNVINVLSYNVTQLDNAYSVKYSEYYNFLGWCLTKEYDENMMLTDSNGTLLANVAGYTNADGKWIRESFDGITLYAQWEKPQIYEEYTYIASADDFKWHIGNNLQKTSKPANCGAGKYLLLSDIDLGDWNEGWGYTYWPDYDESTTLNGKTCFTGHFDGNGKTISYKLRIGKTKVFQTWAFGLFPVTDGATILNLNVVADLSTYDPQNRGQKWDISNDDRCTDALVGGLIGYAKNTTVRNCNVSGRVYYNSDGGDDTCVGGLIGYAHGSTVTDCTAYDIEVYGRGYYIHVAGIIACYYQTTCERIYGNDADNYIHLNEDWVVGGDSWISNTLAKEIQIIKL